MFNSLNPIPRVVPKMCLEKIVRETEAMKALQELGYGHYNIPCQNLDVWSDSEYFCKATKQKVEPTECYYQFIQKGYFQNKCYQLTPSELLFILNEKKKEESRSETSYQL